MAAKRRYHSPELDMNPMVDLAFLLVTFFMLTTTFKMPEPVPVILPASHAMAKLPERDILQITVASDGRVFLDLDGKYTREALVLRMGEQQGLVFSADQAAAFGLAGGHGMPLENLGAWLDLPPKARQAFPQPGIPTDSNNNQLGTWLVLARSLNPALRVAIRADQDVPYGVVKGVIQTLLDRRITRFNLVTERTPDKTPIP